MELEKKSFDVIIVGAGTGGTTAARFLAQKGIDVCLIDRKEKAKIGDKICGDAVGTDIFNFLTIKPPKDAELSCHIKGAKLYSPNREKCITINDPKQAGYIVNRLAFGQRLLNEALDAGVKKFLDNTMALELIYHDYAVTGLKVRLKNGEKIDLSSKLVIDAGGFNSPLRKQVKNALVEKEIADEDVILCYREIISYLDHAQTVMDPEYITIILDQEKAPGGYIWYFPRNQFSVNLGLGVYMNYGGKVKELYQSNVFREFIKSDQIKINSTGGGAVSVRRPLWSCIDNGIMFVGDTACHVNPLHGGGIDPSMRAGYFASLTAIDALEKGDYSSKLLWDYNYKIMTTFGAEFASLDLLRIALQKLSNTSLNFGLSKDLLTGTDIIQIASSGRVQLKLIDLAFKAFKGITKPKLLLDLNYLRIQMNEIFKHYKNFPKKVEDFENWKIKTIQIYDKIKKSTFG